MKYKIDERMKLVSFPLKIVQAAKAWDVDAERAGAVLYKAVSDGYLFRSGSLFWPTQAFVARFYAE